MRRKLYNITVKSIFIVMNCYSLIESREVIYCHVLDWLSEVWDWIFNLLTTYCISLTELHTPNTRKSSTHKFFLVTDFNSGDSSASLLSALSLLVRDSLTILSLLQLTNSQDGSHFTPTSESSLHNLLSSNCSSESESELIYDWRFTANQFVLATSPLRLTTSIFSSTEHLRL
jgi:hypothetical protein